MAALEQQRNVRVVVRVRPAVPREYQYDQAVDVDGDTTVRIAGPKGLYSSSFDNVFGEAATNDSVYEQQRGCVEAVMAGFNWTMLAYGQTGSGKTYSLLGPPGHSLAGGGRPGPGSPHGVMPRAVYELFGAIDARRRAAEAARAGGAGGAAAGCGLDCSGGGEPAEDGGIRVVCSYLEIFNNNVYDLLQPCKAGRDPLHSKSPLEVREAPGAGVCVPSAVHAEVRSWRDVFALIDAGGRSRAVRATDFNAHSSRSHAVLQLWVEQRLQNAGGGASAAAAAPPQASGSGGASLAGAASGLASAAAGTAPDGGLVRSKLTFVDLAGSERWGARHTDAVGANDRGLITELTGINTSLSALALVVSALTGGCQAKHIPYRDSKLTYLLQDSLGGNAITTLLATLPPSADAADESLATLRFADRTRNIANRPHVNRCSDPKAMLVLKEREIQRLRALLSSLMDAGGTSGMPSPPRSPMSPTRASAAHQEALAGALSGPAPPAAGVGAELVAQLEDELDAAPRRALAAEREMRGRLEGRLAEEQRAAAQQCEATQE